MDVAFLWCGFLLPGSRAVRIHVSERKEIESHHITIRVPIAGLINTHETLFVTVPKFRLGLSVLCGLHKDGVIASASKHAAIAVVNVDCVGVVQVGVNLC